MQAQATIDLIDHIKKEIESKQLVSKLDALLDLLKLITGTEDDNIADDLCKKKEELAENLRDIEPSDWSYSKSRILREIDKQGVIGIRGAQNFLSLFEKNYANTAGLSRQIKTFITEIKKLENINTELLEVFLDEETSEGKSLLTLIFEGHTKVSTINDFERYTRIWNKIIKDYSCLINGDVSEPEIYCIDKDSMIIEIPNGDMVLESISYGAARIIEAYKKILRIRKLQLEVVSLALDNNIYKALESEVNTTIEITSQMVVRDLMSINNMNNVDDDDDIFVNIRTSLRQILDFIDKGGKLECTSSKYSEDLVNQNKLFLTAYKIVNEIDNTSVKIADLLGEPGAAIQEV